MVITIFAPKYFYNFPASNLSFTVYNAANWHALFMLTSFIQSLAALAHGVLEDIFIYCMLDFSILQMLDFTVFQKYISSN